MVEFLLDFSCKQAILCFLVSAELTPGKHAVPSVTVKQSDYIDSLTVFDFTIWMFLQENLTTTIVCK